MGFLGQFALFFVCVLQIRAEEYSDLSIEKLAEYEEARCDDCRFVFSEQALPRFLACRTQRPEEDVIAERACQERFGNTETDEMFFGHICLPEHRDLQLKFDHCATVYYERKYNMTLIDPHSPREPFHECWKNVYEEFRGTESQLTCDFSERVHEFLNSRTTTTSSGVESNTHGSTGEAH